MIATLQELDQVRKSQSMAAPLLPRRKRLWVRDGKKCHWCGCPTRMIEQQYRDQATVDHIIPTYKGGSNDDSNMVSACHVCNQRRNKEDQMGHPEGFLLKKNWAPTLTIVPSPAPADSKPPKKKVFPVVNTYQDQRDQALKEIKRLHGLIKDLEIERDAAVGMTLRRFIFRKIKAWIDRQEF